MRVLIGCEESQVVCKAFRAKGHEAYSCDLMQCSGGHPEWHMQGDINGAIEICKWDFIGLHLPCTKVAVSGNRWYGVGTEKHHERIHSVMWMEKIWKKAISKADMVYLENPVGVLNKYGDFPLPQYIQPWQFGHGETKKTGLWLHNLSPLQHTHIVEGREQRIWKMGPSPERANLRSKTYQGIADAMAEQWGQPFESQTTLDLRTDLK